MASDNVEAMKGTDSMAATAPLEEFLEAMREDRNLWWQVDCGHHENLFDAALHELEYTLTAWKTEVAFLKGQLDSLKKQLDGLRKLIEWTGYEILTDSAGYRLKDGTYSPVSIRMIDPFPSLRKAIEWHDRDPQ
jgi:hypothetical protein